MSSVATPPAEAEKSPGDQCCGEGDPKREGMSLDAREKPRRDAPSPGVDIHAVLGLPRPKRPSERSAQEEDSQDWDTDDGSDSDDHTEEWQEGEYLVMDDPEDEERNALQTEMLSENASRTRHSLVPIFTACCIAYERWIRENVSTVPEEDLRKRRQQRQLYQQVLQLYGTDAEWEGLTHAQRVNRNQKAHDTSLEAKKLGLPPTAVTEASVAYEQK